MYFTAADGSETRYVYDGSGRVTATVTADGARTELSYDALGNLTKTVDALGNEMTYAYTADSLLEAVTYANGATLTASYDLLGNLTSETDPLGAVTAYEYDPLGRLTAVTDALGCTTRYEYDAADRLTKVTDALGHVTRYTYDANGNLTSETDALGNTVRYSYTPEGWLETVTDAEGHITRYTYDRTGSVLTADYAGEQFETNAYNELGLRTTVTTAEGDTLYQYDEAGRLISVTQPNGETVSYTYDSHGNRTSMTYPNGKTATYTYDEMNRLIAVKGVDGATTRYEYDALGRRIATDGVKEDTVYVYDAVGNLVSQTTTGKLELSFEYVYDLAGRMMQESRTENGATLISSYLYDALGQLTSFTRSDGLSETYTYDPVGNMTAKMQNGVQTAMRYNAANQLTQSVTNGAATTYTYDASGNLLRSENAGGARSYAYNALGLLSQFIREDGYTETYSYNANRLLSSITTSEDLTTTLTWDILYGDSVVIGAAHNGEQTSYTYGLERISAFSGKIRTEYAYDGRGSVAGEVSYNTAWYTLGGLLARKNVVSKSYSPFGELLTEQASGFGYNGEYYSAATGMIYLRARFYEPEMNRFSQKDTLRGSIIDGISLNRYLYVQNDPIDYVDIDGRRMVAVNMTDGGGSFRSSQTYKSYLAEGQQLVNDVKQYVRQAYAAWQEAEAYAPGSQAARSAMEAWKQAKAAANSASSNLGSLQSAGSLGAANNYIANIRSAASTAKNAASDALTCADRAAASKPKATVYPGNPVTTTQQISRAPEVQTPTTEAVGCSRERISDGVEHVVKGAFYVGVGILAVAVASTVGLPVILALAAAAVTAATVTYGAAEMGEGIDTIIYGARGDTTTAVYNPLRDGLLGGNQDRYDAFGDIAISGSFAVGMYAPVASDVWDSVRDFSVSKTNGSTSQQSQSITASEGSEQSIMESLCFVAGTLVKTKNGEKPIEEVEVGDQVWAWDEDTGETALKEVLETYVNETNDLIHVFVNGEEIITTPGHPFYSPVKGWTDAVHLRAGDILVLVNGEYVVVEKVQHELLEAPIHVYNFSVEGYHTYYVSSSGVLVHNRCDYRGALQKQTGTLGAGMDAHHVFPQEFRQIFSNYGINIDNARYLSWVDSPIHRSFSYAYSQDWAAFLSDPHTTKEVFDFARMLALKYDFELLF